MFEEFLKCVQLQVMKWIIKMQWVTKVTLTLPSSSSSSFLCYYTDPSTSSLAQNNIKLSKFNIKRLFVLVRVIKIQLSKRFFGNTDTTFCCSVYFCFVTISTTSSTTTVCQVWLKRVCCKLQLLYLSVTIRKSSTRGYTGWLFKSSICHKICYEIVKFSY